METWRDVVGFEGYYVVSDRGRVMRVARGKGTRPGTIRKLFTDHLGYQRLLLSKNGKYFTRSVHRLVTEAFLGPAPEGYEVNHKNGDKEDNNIDNLEWVTHSGNQRHRYDVLKKGCACGSRCHTAKLTEDDIPNIRRLAADGMSRSKIAVLYGVSQPMISYIVNRANWRHVE